jgi:hypothetical protein
MVAIFQLIMDWRSSWQSWGLTLAILGIDLSSYYGENLSGKNVQQMFQESDIILLQFQELLLGVDKEDGQCNSMEIFDIARRYFELCTLCDYFFSSARTHFG